MLILLPSIAAACESWSDLTALAPITSPGLEESSGVAPSRRTPGLLWTHDDSGTPELFRFGIDGTVTVHGVPAADNRDWEDIASAPCGSRDACLYIGDIGGERGSPDELQVYVVVEPSGDGDARLREQWDLRWPSGARDAETLLVHPCTQAAWIVTRGDLTEVFAIDDDRGPTATDLRPVTSLSIGTITGGDFAPDGSALVLRTQDAIWRWTVDPDDVEGVFSTTPVLVVDGLAPGEALTWEADGDLIVTSEGAPTPVGRLACEQPVEPAECSTGGCGCSLTPQGQASWAWWVVAAVVGARRVSRRSRASS